MSSSDYSSTSSFEELSVTSEETCNVCFKALEDYILCEYCNEAKICNKCRPNYQTQIVSWFAVENQCSICNKILCINCMKVCHTCCNEYNGEQPLPISCPQCIKFTNKCEYHFWDTCEKHKNVSCGECNANRNYNAKHSMF